MFSYTCVYLIVLLPWYCHLIDLALVVAILKVGQVTESLINLHT